MLGWKRGNSFLIAHDEPTAVVLLSTLTRALRRLYLVALLALCKHVLENVESSFNFLGTQQQSKFEPPNSWHIQQPT